MYYGTGTGGDLYFCFGYHANLVVLALLVHGMEYRMHGIIGLGLQKQGHYRDMVPLS